MVIHFICLFTNVRGHGPLTYILPLPSNRRLLSTCEYKAVLRVCVILSNVYNILPISKFIYTGVIQRVSFCHGSPPYGFVLDINYIFCSGLQIVGRLPVPQVSVP